MLFDEKVKNLPLELRLHIWAYSLPKLDELLKRGIMVTSSHQSIVRASKKWRLKRLTQDWPDFLSEYYLESEMKDIFNGLSNCGCCVRHSKGFLDDVVHCQIVQGSFTQKKFNKKDVLGYGKKKCSCWCRHNMRQLSRAVEDKRVSIN